MIKNFKKFKTMNESSEKTVKEMKNAIYNFITKFDTNTTSWSEATGEIVDLHKYMAKLYNERNEENKGIAVYKNPHLISKRSSTPSEWNTVHVEGVTELLEKMHPDDIEETYQYFEHWFA